jgi:hypothetical protein
MFINVPFIYKAKIIKPRCRKPITVLVRDQVEVEIKEVSEASLPIAFKVGNWEQRFDGQHLWNINLETIYNEKPRKIYLTEVINNTLDCSGYKWSNSGPAAPFNKFWTNIEDFVLRTDLSHAWLKDDILTKDEIVAKEWVGDNRDEVISAAKAIAGKLISMNGLMMCVGREPRYEVNSFGAGRNYSVAMFISYGYNENISKTSYFNALEFDKAQDSFVKRSPDKNKVAMPNCGNTIEVLIKAAVKCNPKLDHVA